MPPDQIADCATCNIGAAAIYGPTFLKSAALVSDKRISTLRFKAHQIIHRSGETPKISYTLKEGWAYRAVNLHDGRRQILSFVLPGDTICIEAIWVPNYRVPFTVRTLTDVTLCGFPPEALNDIINSNAAQRDCFAVHIQRQSALAERRLLDVGQRRAIARIACLVLDLESVLRSRDLSHGDTIAFPIRQEDIGDSLGLTTAHVNRTLLELRRRGVLDIRQGQAHLLDRQELKKICTDN